jgi:hypothetical protein
MILAASLPQLEFQPGMPLPSLEQSNVVSKPFEDEPYVAVPISDLFKGLFILALAGSILYLVLRLMKGASWKDIGSYIQSLMIMLLIVGSFFFMMLFLPRSQNSIALETNAPVVAQPIPSPLGPVPPLLVWLIGIVLSVSGILVGIWIFGLSPRQAKTIDLVGLEAEKAWQALKTGLELKDVIVKCYRQMSLALEKEQGIERKEYMTTREFEKLLGAAGVPSEPIHQLTGLFDAVRYGHWQPNPIDEQKAIRSLEAIVYYARDGKKAK